MRFETLLLSVLLILTCSCTSSPSSPSSGGSSIQADYPEKGIVHWKSYLEWDDDTIEEAARSKMIIVPIFFCLSPVGEDVIDRLKEENHDIKIIGYQEVLGVPISLADTATSAYALPYSREYYDLVKDYRAWTTTGDTLCIWPGHFFINPFSGGVPDPGLIDGIIDLIADRRDGRERYLDGIMHDYFMYRPYINYLLKDTVEGEIDLDGNGIPVEDDPLERERFLEWQIEYARRFRARFGPDFIQVANGRVPQENAELAGLINGIFYELYPNMTWGITDREGMEILTANQADGYLSKACGRTWSIITNDAVDYNNYFCMISSMLTGCLYAELFHGPVFGGWTLDLEPGLPQSGLIVEGRADSITTYRRLFTGGEARISFASYGGRIKTEFISGER